MKVLTFLREMVRHMIVQGASKKYIKVGLNNSLTRIVIVAFNIIWKFGS